MGKFHSDFGLVNGQGSIHVATKICNRYEERLCGSFGV